MKEWRKFLEAALLAGTSLMFLYLYISGEIALYIHSRFHPLTLATGIVLALLAVGRLVIPAKACGCAQLKPYVYSIFLLPIIIGLFSPVRVLDAGLANRRGISLQPPLAVPAWNAPPVGAIRLDDQNYMTIYANLYSNPQKFKGRVVEVEGFVLHKDEYGPGTFIVARYSITCCIADAVLLGFLANWQGSTTIAENDWVKVAAIVQPELYNDKLVPMLVIQYLEVIRQPRNPYIFN